MLFVIFLTTFICDVSCDDEPADTEKQAEDGDKPADGGAETEGDKPKVEEPAEDEAKTDDKADETPKEDKTLKPDGDKSADAESKSDDQPKKYSKENVKPDEALCKCINSIAAKNRQTCEVGKDYNLAILFPYVITPILQCVYPAVEIIEP